MQELPEKESVLWRLYFFNSSLTIDSESIASISSSIFFAIYVRILSALTTTLLEFLAILFSFLIEDFNVF